MISKLDTIKSQLSRFAIGNGRGGNENIADAGLSTLNLPQSSARIGGVSSPPIGGLHLFFRQLTFAGSHGCIKSLRAATFNCDFQRFRRSKVGDGRIFCYRGFHLCRIHS